MTIPNLSLEQLEAEYQIDQDRLFDNLLWKLNNHRNVILLADQDRGVKEYVYELGFQLTEKNPDIHICYMDISPVRTSGAFLELFVTALSHSFPEVIPAMEIDNGNINILKLPALIAKRERINVAVFLANTHLFHQFKDAIPFLMTLKLRLKNQKKCVFCLHGNNTPYFRDLVYYPGPLSGLGQPSVLKHNPLKQRSTSIRKFFHVYHKNIGYRTSLQLSYVVDNHPFYLKLLAWHALIRTQNTCTMAIIDKALTDLVHHYDYIFSKIVENLTEKQISFLKALVEGSQKLYSEAIRDEYQLGSSSNIARIKLSLEQKDIICTRYGEFCFIDPLFREWLERCYFGRQ